MHGSRRIAGKPRGIELSSTDSSRNWKARPVKLLFPEARSLVDDVNCIYPAELNSPRLIFWANESALKASVIPVGAVSGDCGGYSGYQYDKMAWAKGRGGNSEESRREREEERGRKPKQRK